MFDFFANSVDGLIILSYIIALVLFFLYGPHKVYEAFFGALLGLGCYLFVYQMTFVTPDITRTLIFGNLIVDNRGILLFSSNVIMVFLFFFSPISVGIHARGMVRGSLWFVSKIIILSACFVLFGVALLSLSSGILPIMRDAPLYSRTFLQTPFFTNAQIYLWIMDRAYSILLIGFFFAFYKIIFSHWLTKLGFFLGALYSKGNEIFGKRNFDQGSLSSDSDGSQGSENHTEGDAHSGH
ncbi:MAG: hypothetical protein WC753_00700 [Candidatus Gracilibacteria bacterium]